MVRTVKGEAEGEGAAGQQAVAAAIMNRAAIAQRMRGGPYSVCDVVLTDRQFSPWNKGGKQSKCQPLLALDSRDPAYVAVDKNIAGILAGTQADPTGGADHFWSPKSQAAVGGKPPKWAKSKTPVRTIGEHRFYRFGGFPRPLRQGMSQGFTCTTIP